MSTSLALRTLQVRGFRNLAVLELEAGRANVVFGDNGQGKTSLLEAIYVLCTSKSFRCSKLREAVSHGASGFSIRGSLLERRGELEPIAREQSARLVRGALEVRLEGNKPPTLADYATKSPVVVFHPDELALSTGAAAIRRRLLDRVALHADPRSVAANGAYARALRSRKELLRSERDSPGELDAYEDIAARAGAELTRARRAAIEALAPHMHDAFARIAAPDLELSIAYEPGGTDDADRARRELRDRRTKDAAAPTATFGPHRDDVVMRLGSHSVRHVASQGQHRALTLALKAAESATIARLSGLEPIQLLDDVSSELDPSRTDALFRFLLEARGQLFLTTTRPELVERALEQVGVTRIRLVSGALRED